MHAGQFIFAQLMDFLPRHEFSKCVRRYRGNARTRGFSCFDQFFCMAFAQLTYRESLRDIETCLRAMGPKLYHAGFRGRIARSTLADANEHHDWRIYADFAHVYVFTQQSAFFVIRSKRNMDYSRQPYRAVDKSTGLRSDQKITLQGVKTSRQYPEALRRITYRDTETQKRFAFLTNNGTLPALTIAWIAISVYVLVAIVKKELKLERSLYEILQILSVALFEKTPILEALSCKNYTNERLASPNQLSLFNL